MHAFNDTKSAALCAQDWDSAGKRGGHGEEGNEAEDLHSDDECLIGRLEWEEIVTVTLKPI
jgi:hypothetical protein